MIPKCNFSTNLISIFQSLDRLFWIIIFYFEGAECLDKLWDTLLFYFTHFSLYDLTLLWSTCYRQEHATQTDPFGPALFWLSYAPLSRFLSQVVPLTLLTSDPSLTPYKRAIHARYQTVDFGLLCESVLNKNLKHLQFLFSVVHDRCY
jgi:hypothetical protein